MGYTHYWNRKKKLDKPTWTTFTHDLKELLDQADVPLAHYVNGASKKGYRIKPSEINFNGTGEDGHENVYIPRIRKSDAISAGDKGDMCFGFCKTAHKPYDKYVTACLLLFKMYFGKDVEISSDGGASGMIEGRDMLEDMFEHVSISTHLIQKWVEDEEDEEDEAVEEAVVAEVEKEKPQEVKIKLQEGVENLVDDPDAEKNWQKEYMPH